MEEPFSTKKKKAKWLPTVPWVPSLRSYSMNDALKNRVEYPCWQTPGSDFVAVLQERKSYFESKNAHSSPRQNNCNVQKELMRTTAIQCLRTEPRSSHVLWQESKRSWIVRWWLNLGCPHKSTRPSLLLTCCSVKYWKEHGLWSLTDLDSNPSSVTYWLSYFGEVT